MIVKWIILHWIQATLNKHDDCEVCTTTKSQVEDLFQLLSNNELGENESIFAEPCVLKLCPLSFWNKAIKGLVTYI
jgi:hypothetical protein